MATQTLLIEPFQYELIEVVNSGQVRLRPVTVTVVPPPILQICEGRVESIPRVADKSKLEIIIECPAPIDHTIFGGRIVIRHLTKQALRNRCARRFCYMYKNTVHFIVGP